MIIDSYDDTEPLFGLQAFYGEKKHLLDKCMILFSKELFDYMLTNRECRLIAESKACNGATPIYCFDLYGEPVAFYLSPIGSTGAGTVASEVNWLTGATKFVMFGSCGSLDRQKTDGRYIIPTEAYRDEGMSYHYVPAADYIAVKNSDKLAAIFDRLHVPYVKGRVWTTDAMLRETKMQVALRKADGCIAVEMEVAGVQAVCDYNGWELYDFLQAGDVLIENEYDASGLHNADHDLQKLLIALNVLHMI